MRAVHRAILIAAAGLLGPGLYHCQASAQDSEPSEQTLATMRRHVSSLTAVGRSAKGEESPLKLLATPVLRYSDPGGITTDGSIWVWGERGRPAAAAGIFFLTQEGREPKWSCELLSLADGGVTVRSGAGWSWSPSQSGLVWLALKDPPADSPRQRLRQMKQIAERYEVAALEKTQRSVSGGGLRSGLRLMVQPLHRYADEEQGLVDGAIFSFAAGTNPEVLLLVECRKAADAPAWHVAFARFGASALQARQGETIVWECPAIQRWDTKAPYFSHFGAADHVFAPAQRRSVRP
jgi:hypothetical protein